ncbi:hypothetical protein CCAX7_006900 [Capsulimonas corticalis]|uniref:Uncharacterized protein n=1 Tax=Capsulimonas corticalis TaxID=2219043 RepID=A0A402D1M4_9BACT|nr:hypothetical protein [Capsulimonas corticalis]BDI28639.1 hypothetical protein CCAX7_006900 [Capsulimonas corticalis]
MATRISSSFLVAPAAALVCSLLSLPAFAQSIPAPEGWTQKVEDGATVFTPGDLAPKQLYAVAIFPSADLAGQKLESWMEKIIRRDDPALASPFPPGEIKHPSDNVCSYSHVYSTPIGPVVTLYTALAKGRAYLSRVVTSPDETLTDRYKPATGEILDAYWRRDDSSAATPPAARKLAKQQRPPEDQRFRWVAAPGKGLTPAKIEGIVHEGHGETQIGGYAFVESATLLLKDGTCYSGMQCAPADLDVAASRLHEPGAWGRWRRQGKSLQARWKGNVWSPLVGEFVVPARAGERLLGNFTTGSAINIAGNISTFHRGIEFLPGGRFHTSRSSLFTSGVTSNLATGTSISAYSDDNGSVVGAAPAAGAIMPGSAAVSNIKKRNPNGANEGVYQLSGYTLTLRYDNGEVTRLPFFFWDAKRDYIWVGTETFNLDK